MQPSVYYPYSIPNTALRWNRAIDHLIEKACRFEQLMRDKAGYRPEQPRDYRGRWTGTGVSGRLSATETWGDKKTLDKHVKDHGKDFGVNSADQYTKRANDFYKRGQAEKLPTVIDKHGVTRMYDPKTNTFGSYNPDGSTRTFYKPTSKNYFDNQIRQYAGWKGIKYTSAPNHYRWWWAQRWWRWLGRWFGYPWPNTRAAHN